MKRRILSVLLAALMILSILPVSLASAAMLGDIDGDGKISSDDARLALRASVRLEALTEAQKLLADVDFDGEVTSSDARSILRAAVGLESLHVHSYTEAVTKTAGCTETGIKTFTCSCGDAYTEDIPATGHTPVTDAAVAPTCTAGGKTEGSHCKSCGTILTAQNTVAATGHVSSSLDQSTVREATCTEKGYSGDYKCDVCGTVTSRGSETPVNEHKHVIVRVTVSASCTEDGYTVEKCKYDSCEYFDTQSIEPTGETAKGHQHANETVVLPTCTKEGYTVKTCSRCGDEIRYDYVSEKGHDYDWTTEEEASCIKAGKENGECTVCHDKISRTIPLQPCTDIDTVLVPGNATTLCKVVAKCNTCGTEVNERPAEDYEHLKPVKTQAPTSPTCTEPGTVDVKCDSCYKTIDDYVVTEPLGHEADPDRENTWSATCTQSGQLAYTGTCTRCGEPVENEVIIIPAKGHQLEGVQTCTTAVTCKVCHIEYAPKLGHDYVIPSAVSAYERNTPAFFCNRCGEGADDNLQTFNDVTGLIKTSIYGTEWDSEQRQYKNTVSFFDKSSIKTEYSRFDFGIYTSAIKSMYEEEMANTPDEFSTIRKNWSIRANLPINNNQVSVLTADDIDSIKVERLSSFKVSDALASYPDTYTVGNTTYDLTPYKNTPVRGEVIKVTIDVKNESYKGGVMNLPETQMTHLQKIFDLDIREEANGFKDENGNFNKTESDVGDGYEITMTMVLQDIKSDGNVVYYFNADTYEPILAVYNTNITMTQNIAMKFKISLFSLNGELDPIITTDTTRVYFFSGTFGK